MSEFDLLKKNLLFIEEAIGYSFHSRDLLLLAFIHRSFVNENKEVDAHNERLEFLGDAVLGLLAAEYLYCDFPSMPEGEMSALRSRLVEAPSCVQYIQRLDLEKHLLLGKGEKMNDGRGRESILADLFEAIIGAIYLDGGLGAAKKFLFGHFSDLFQGIVKEPVRNWKSLLQDYCQKKYQQAPLYHLLSEGGPDHSKIFKVSVTVENQEIGLGQGSSKKQAQQKAAKDALEKFNLI